ncbi:MAG: hypothetical protein JSS81_23125 [Acidobacteria bacterium]|nr:hypothetical protein [Acidobacteriota bacterium]
MKKYLLFAVLVFNLSIISNASEPEIWSVNSRADVLKGDARGVSIDDNGVITLAPKLTETFRTDQPYVWSSAVDANGSVYLGTGGDGKVFKVDANGKGALFADLAELNVSALAVGKAGEIFAATLPDGKVYRLDANGAATVYFDPKEKYIWSLAVLPDGSLAVGTGENGKIYKVKAANAAPDASLLFDTSETHIIALAADKQGNLYAGTDSNGLVLKFSPDGKPFGVLDSPLREIHELSVAPDGSVYALALGESVSAPKTDATTTTATTESKAVTVEKPSATTTETAPKSRYDLSSAKSAVYHIYPDGGSDVVWNSAAVAAFSVAANQNGVLVGTSDKGRIYGVTNDGRETLVLQTDEGQVSTILAGGQKMFATTSNSGKLFAFGAEPNAEGAYESAVLDAKVVASWGRIWWSAAGGVQFQTRSGNTERPNETWSAWSAPAADAKGAQIASPKARYFQWRVTLRGAASLREVSVSFLGRNIAPEVLSIQVLPTNIALAPNPPVQIDPNIELSGMDPALFGVAVPPAGARRVYQRGARALQWTAEDRNGDKLVYDIYYREATETGFKLLKENLTDTFFTLDGQSLADGHYVFRVVAKDTISNPAGLALAGERLSEPFEIDNAAPVVTAAGAPQIAAERARVVFDASEGSGYLIRAEFSVNGGEWQEVYADDGISDSQKERYTVEIPVKTPGEYSVTLRVFDADGNSGNARVIVRK